MFVPPRGRVPDVRKAHEDLLERGAPPVGVRGMVADSWLRPAAAGVDAEAGQPPITLVADQLGEYMVILAACPAGLTADELAYLLYPAGVMSSTPRAELIRLRALLGDHVLASRPYRLTCEVASDWAAVSAQLAAGNLGEALRLYHGPLLPRSEAPGVAGFFWLAGQGGYGIQTSPAMGRIIASLIAARGIPTDIADEGVSAGALDPARLKTNGYDTALLPKNGE